MARKLTESQRVIRQLQTAFSNAELSRMLGYKGTTQVRKISGGKSNLSPARLEQARQLLQSQGIAPSRRTPRPSEIRERQRRFRKTKGWQEIPMSVYLQYISSHSFNAEKASNKLNIMGIRYVYYHDRLQAYFLSREHLNPDDITPLRMTGVFFQSTFTNKNGENVVQSPVYPWLSVYTEDEMSGDWDTISEATTDFLINEVDAFEPEEPFPNASPRYWEPEDDVVFLGFVGEG